MKNKTLKLFALTSMMACAMAVPAFAAETKAEYRTEAAEVKEDIKDINEKLAALRAENKAVVAKIKAVRTERKETGTLPIDKDAWEQIKTLQKESAQYRAGEEERNENKALRVAVKQSVENGNYDAALNSFNEILENRKERLDKVEKINQYMQQIDALLTE